MLAQCRQSKWTVCIQQAQRRHIHRASMMISQTNGIHDANEITRSPQPTIISPIIQAIQAHDCQIAAVMMMIFQVMTVHYHFFHRIIWANDKNKRPTTMYRIHQCYAVHRVVHETQKTVNSQRLTLECLAQHPDDLQRNDNQCFASCFVFFPSLSNEYLLKLVFFFCQ